MQLAFRFLIGNDAMHNSSSKVFRLVTKVESAMISKTVLKEYKSELNKKDSKLRIANMERNHRKYSFLKTILQGRMVLKLWREYSRLKELFGKTASGEQLEKLIEKQRNKELQYFTRRFPDKEALDKILHTASLQTTHGVADLIHKFMQEFSRL